MITDRINFLINRFCDGNKSLFAKKIGVGPSVIGNITGDRKGNPSFDVIKKTLDAFVTINARWFITGVGEIFQSDNHSFDNKISNIEGITVLDKLSTYISNSKTKKSVPFYDIPVSAGQHGLINIGGEDSYPSGYVQIDIFNNCDAVLPVVGVSMDPIIVNGDYIGVKRIISNNWKEIPTGRIYLLVTQDDRMIKFLKSASDPQKILLSSPNYNEFFVDKQSVIEIYRVIAYMHTL